MPQFRFVPWGEDIIRLSVAEAADRVWLIYPTERSRREAELAFQQAWQPLDVHFVSLDEFKHSHLFSGQIWLEEEKRLVCLYQALTAEDKEYFHLHSYEDFIGWGQHWFALFDELAEECLDPELLHQRMQNLEFDYQDWQLEHYVRLLAIREQYRAFITGKGFGDKVFDLLPANLHPPAVRHSYLFINQYYYTGLEKAIIRRLEANGHAVSIWYQGKVEWFDPETLSAREFSLEEAFPDGTLPFELRIFEAGDQWQMALSFLAGQAEDAFPQAGRHLIVDGQFWQQPYRKVFDRQRFAYPEQQPLFATRLFRFFQLLAKALNLLIRDNGRLYLATDWWLQALSTEGFIAHFRPDWSPGQQTALQNDIYRLSGEDILYIDRQLQVLSVSPYLKFNPATQAFMAEVWALLDRLLAIRCIGDFTALLDVPEGIRTDRLIDRQEEECSNLAGVFYPALVNFSALEQLALVDNWQEFYPQRSVAAALLNLWLEFLKPKTYHWSQQAEFGGRSEITNLMDTRNLQAERVSILNITEGELPSGRTAVWLFNERQRQQIGLKHWEDIRRWERYYLFRLLAAAHSVSLYTIQSETEDVQPSSFVHELYLFSKDKVEPNQELWRKVMVPPETLLRNWIRPRDEFPPLQVKADLPGIDRNTFFRLRYEHQVDYGEAAAIRLTWSSCERFLADGFGYYLQDLCGLKHKTVRLEETFNARVFGILLHQYLMVISTRLAEQHQGTLSMKREWISREFLQANLAHIFTNPLWDYLIPKNYNKAYLETIMQPFMVESALHFFHHELGTYPLLRDAQITIIPEGEELAPGERYYKELVAAGQTPTDMAVLIRGKADLRLETPGAMFILDFKTGDMNKKQLLFYAWFYYLIEHPAWREHIYTGFYKLLDMQFKWEDIRDDSKGDPLLDELLLRLHALPAEGFPACDKSGQKRYFLDISRADLLATVEAESDDEGGEA